MPGGAATIDESLAKKRARDRRAQQTLRDRRLANNRVLEERVAALESELSSTRQTCHVLRLENEVLRSRQQAIQQAVASWGPQASDLQSVGAFETRVENPETNISPSHRSEDDRIPLGPQVNDCRDSADPICTDCTLSAQPETSPNLGHPWHATPVHSDSDLVITDRWSRWLSRPDLVAASPDVPLPVDLLFGSKTNFLADAIHQGTRRWPSRDPERLAQGWLSYNMIKWMSNPTEATFARLCEFQKPVLEQLRHPHPYFIDFMLWPALRANLANCRPLYDVEGVVGLIVCCIKVRWPWNQPVIEPDDKGQLQIRPDFLETFTKIEGWGLTDDFISRYPELVQGLDVASLRYVFSDALSEGR